MLYPAVNKLEEVTKSRYALCILTAKRARQISENAMQEGVSLDEKPVKLAIKDIASGKIVCKENN